MLITTFEAKRWKDHAMLARRVGQLIKGEFSSFQPYYLDGSGLWHIDAGNDWWMRVNEDQTCELHTRYPSVISEEQAKALQTVLNWALA
jgi:hypothetical protein